MRVRQRARPGKMLNCTDLECILHHHHYYAHLHQLQPHLGDRGRDGECGFGDGVEGRWKDSLDFGDYSEGWGFERILRFMVECVDFVRNARINPSGDSRECTSLPFSFHLCVRRKVYSLRL